MTENFSASHLIAPRSLVSQEMRESRQRHVGMVFWLTGLSGAGKSTLAHLAEARLFAGGYNVVVFDGDVVRAGLCADLGFSSEDRKENNRRIAEVAKLFMRSGAICLCAFISPLETVRNTVREIVGPEYFREVFIACSVEECERRDVKGFYKKARQGLIKNYTGVGSTYEEPVKPDCSIRTENESPEQCTDLLVNFIKEQAGKNAVSASHSERK